MANFHGRTEEMDECLLKLALHHGAHLPHLGDKKAPKNGAPSFHPKPSDRWRDVVRDFFSDSTGGQPYSEKHFKLDKDDKPEYRKIKDHFETVCNVPLRTSSVVFASFSWSCSCSIFFPSLADSAASASAIIVSTN